MDHKLARNAGGTDDPSNLHWLCHGCHSRKTAKKDGGFGHPRVA
ncbi:HNH endonuclease [Bradyrhizobium sp. 23]|nr:HNH endonuclease [Bradyrhizobium sp. 23]